MIYTYDGALEKMEILPSVAMLVKLEDMVLSDEPEQKDGT